MANENLSEFLKSIGKNDFVETVDEYRRDIIKIKTVESEEFIPVGTSKFGGYPDLPPQFPYPTMSGYSCSYGEKMERYEESAMQLIAQINLYDIRKYDANNLLPHEGMLYFFWSGEISPIHAKNKYYEGKADDESKADYYKVIWYNGDLSNLIRTKPDIPYYSKYFSEVFKEYSLEFNCDVDYERMGDVLDVSEFDELAEVAPDFDIDNLQYGSNKIFGYPSGGNVPQIDSDTHLLLQYDYGVGCLWNLFFTISDKDLKNRDFSKVYFGCDMA